MSDTKTRKSHNDTAITVRLPSPILAQLQQLADLQYKSPSQVLRDQVVSYIQNHQNFLIAKGNPALSDKSKTKPMPTFDSPEEERAWLAEQDDPWG